MINILFRADSSSTIGTGHIMRDLVLAKQFLNAHIMFATQDLLGNINHKIEEQGYQIKTLQSETLSELTAIIKNNNIDMLIIDHYDIDADYEKALKEVTGVKLFVLDDTYEEHYCDILLNHNIYARESKYSNLVPESCELKCGVQHTLLRDEFKEEKRNKDKIDKNNKEINIFIAMGGADSANLNTKILNVIENFSNVQANVVTTSANQFLDELKTYAIHRDNVTVHINSNQVAKLMAQADFAIVTPSVILNEVVYMSLPFIAIQTASNQNEMIEYLHQTHAMVLQKFDANQLKLLVEKLIARHFTKLVNFIDLSKHEKELVLEWRNNSTIRQWMFNTEVITLDDHLHYIDSLVSREDRLYFLVKKNDKAIAVIDFTNIDIINSTVECGLYAKPEIKGIGGLLMSVIIDYAFNILKVKTLIAEVFNANKVAIKLYKRYGFKETMKKEINKKVIIHMELTNENR